MTLVEQIYELRKWVGRILPARWSRRYGTFYVWRRVMVEWMLAMARPRHAPEFAAVTVADAVAATPGARVIEVKPPTTTPFPLPRVHTTRRWLLEANPPCPAIAWPAMRVLDLPNGVVFGHEGAVGPDPQSIVTDLGFVYPIALDELFRRSAVTSSRGREVIPGTTLSMLQLFPSNHAHSLVQGVPRLDLFRRAIDLATVDRVLVNVSAPMVMREAITRVGFGPDRVVEVHDDTPLLVCERLLAATPMPTVSGTPPWGIAFACEIFGADGPGRPDGPRRLFVVRDPLDQRGIVNDAEVRAALTARGFVAVAMDGLTIDEQAAVFAAADVIVGAHGAALANLTFARPGTPVLELVGANTLNWEFAPLSWAAGLDHDILVGVETTPPRALWTWQRDAAQIVDVDRLVLLVDRILDSVDAHA